MYDQLTIDPQELCALCGYPLDDVDLVLVESGTIVPRKRDDRTRYFLADWRLPEHQQPDTPVLNLHHFHCFQQLAQGEKWKIDPKDWECHLCDRSDFRRDRWAFQITVGKVGKDHSFVPDPEIQKQGIVCIPCTTALFGDGDDEEGEALLFGTGG